MPLLHMPTGQLPPISTCNVTAGKRSSPAPAVALALDLDLGYRRPRVLGHGLSFTPSAATPLGMCLMGLQRPATGGP